MPPFSLRYQQPTFEEYANQEFIKLLLQTPPDQWDGVTLMKGQVGPLHELTPGVSEIHYDFVMQIDGVADLAVQYDNHHFKAPSLRGGLTFVPCNVLMAFQSNATVQSLGCLSDKHLWSRLAAEFKKGDPAQLALAPRVNFRDPLIESILWALLQELESGNVGGRLYVDALMQTLIIHTLVQGITRAQLHDLPTGAGLTVAQRRLVREFIDANYDREIGLVELAASINFSPAYFARQFKRSFGTTPHQYLTQVRVESAQRLLDEGRMTVGEVAAAVGFYDQSHLAHHFKRAIGVAPKVYLEQRSNGRHRAGFS